MASPAVDPLEAALDELYGSDPAEFVALRKLIAARLRADGARDDAKAVLAARRPTAAAAALNRLAREQPELITDLLDRSGDLRDSFRVSREEVRAATVAHRDALRMVTDAAMAMLGGRSESSRSQIQSTVHAAGLDAEVARRLRTGRLEKEITGPSGFGETEMPDGIPTRRRVPARPGGHLRLAPDPAADSREQAEQDRIERERIERERIERERIERQRIETAARAQRRAELRAALDAAEAAAADASTDREAASRIERELEGQLQTARARGADAEARAQAAQVVVTDLQHRLANESDARDRSQ